MNSLSTQPQPRLLAEDGQQASATTRFLARSIDLGWLVVAAYLVLFTAGFRSIDVLPDTDFGKIANAAIEFAVLSYLALFLDALVYRICGTTLGRAVGGLRILTREGQALTGQQYFDRNMAMIGPGFGFFIVPLNIVAYLVSWHAVRHQGGTKWDTTKGYVVLDRTGGKRVFWLVFVFVSVNGISRWVGHVSGYFQPMAPDAVVSQPVYQPQSADTPPPAISAEPQTAAPSALQPTPLPTPGPVAAGWTNPLSGRVLPLSNWTVTTVQAGSYWVFNHPQGAHLHAWYTPLNGQLAAPLAGYAQQMLSNPKPSLGALSGPGVVGWDTRAVWQGARYTQALNETATAAENVYAVSWIYEGDHGVWFVSYIAPTNVTSAETAIAAERAFMASTSQ
jgi:uncharacterized RDD family membrane protein YckC